MDFQLNTFGRHISAQQVTTAPERLRKFENTCQCLDDCALINRCTFLYISASSVVLSLTVAVTGVTGVTGVTDLRQQFMATGGHTSAACGISCVTCATNRRERG